MGTTALLEMVLLAPALLAAAASVDDNPSVEPAKAKPGAVQQWKAADGLPFEYRVPKGYDPAVGANLTLVLHGNGLDHRWTFWNHPAAEFRADDIVVSPDGTTAHSGTGANEFLAGDSDVARVRALIEELKATWKVNQVFLYGHSQGAFFVYWMAGAEPELIDGVVGHAGGVWLGTETPKKARGQAIGFLHGTDDHIPYGQAVAGRELYASDRKYPLVHLRTLFDWDHRPHWYQAEQVLAWCEGMTSEDPARVAAAMEELTDTKRPMGVDWAALHAVASRLAGLDSATPAQKERAAGVVATVDALAASHVEEMLARAGKKPFAELVEGPWSGVLVRFLEDFRGTPAWTELQADHAKVLEAVREQGVEARKDLLGALEKDEPKALDHAIALLEEGYLHPSLGEALASVDEWLDKTKARLPRKARARYEELAKAWREGRAKGFKEFEQRNAGAKL